MQIHKEFDAEDAPMYMYVRAFYSGHLQQHKAPLWFHEVIFIPLNSPFRDMVIQPPSC